MSSQYAKSADNARSIDKELKRTNSELTFTGHSLGGGEAALNGMITDRKAITFNAAGVGAITKIREGGLGLFFKSEKGIEAYIMYTDPLNHIQNRSSLMPDVNGNVKLLMPTDKSSILNGHSINNVLKNFGVDTP